MTNIYQEFIEFLLETDNSIFNNDESMKLNFLEKFVPMIVNEQSNEFSVNFQDVANFLEVKKGNLKQLLEREAVLNKDYLIELESSSGGRPSENIFLTGECVKTIASLSRTPNGKQVLKYLITMETAYREFILDGIQDSRKNREDDDEDRKRIRPGKNAYKIGHCVYVIECTNRLSNDEIIYKYKVGRTKNLNVRAMTHYHTLDGFRRLIYQKMCIDHNFLESCVHAAIGDLKVESEVFIEDPEKIISIIERCGAMRNEICELSGTCAKSDRAQESMNIYGQSHDSHSYRKTPFQGNFKESF